MLSLKRDKKEEEEGRSLRDSKKKDVWTFEETVKKRTKPTPKSNSERCKDYRDRLKQDPQKYKNLLENDRTRKQLERKLPKSQEQLDHEKHLHKLRQRQYRCRQKEKSNDTINDPRLTRKDAQKLEAKRRKNIEYSQRRRDNYTSQKRAAVNKARRERYYRQKHEKERQLKCTTQPLCTSTPKQPGPTSPDVSSIISDSFVSDQINVTTVHSPSNFNDGPHSVQCERHETVQNAFSSDEALKKAVQRARHKIGQKGHKFVSILKGLKNYAERKVPSAKKILSSPTKVHIESSLTERLNSLKHKNDKFSINLKNEYIKTFGEHFIKNKVGILTQKSDPYENRKENPKDQVVSDFFEDISVHLPTQRNRSAKEKTQKKIMTQTVERAYDIYKSRCETGSEFSLRTFFRRRPQHVLSVSKTLMRQCLCDVCQNPRLKIQTLRPLVMDFHIDLKTLCDETMCEKTGDFHNLRCIDRECEDCGVHRVKDKLKGVMQLKLDEKVKWWQWGQVASGSVKKTMKVPKVDRVETLIDSFCSELQTYPRHVFNDQWQRLGITSLLRNIPKETAIVTMDFSENFLCKNQDEVQSAYWGYKQVTVHPAIVNYNCVQCNDHICTHNYVFLSDDLKHDSHFVDIVMHKIMTVMKAFNFQRYIFISDGCSSQYKSKLPFAYLNVAGDRFPGVKLEKVFFGARHGKNACDGLGGVVKNAVRLAVAADTNLNIQDAKGMLDYCNTFLSQCKFTADSNHTCLSSLRSFILVDPNDVDRFTLTSNMLHTIQGTRDFHHVRSDKKGTLAFRKNSCFCQSCSQTLNDCPLSDCPGSWYEVDLPLPSISHKFNLDKDELTSGQYFQNLHASLSSAKSFTHFLLMCHENHPLVSAYSFEVKDRSLSELKCSVDQIALQMLPNDAPINHYPVNILADGNCLPRAISLLVFGDEDSHIEVRCRLCIEMCLNKGNYLNIDNWIQEENIDPSDLINVLKYTSTECLSTNIQDIFETEVLHSVHSGRFLGLWELFACANILNHPVCSVFPNKGWSLYRNMCNRIINPLGPCDRSPVSIMWSSVVVSLGDEHWCPNHFVPLLPVTLPQISSDATVMDDQALLNDAFVTSCEEESQKETSAGDGLNLMPEIGCHYFVQWNKDVYVAEVLEVDDDSQLVHVSFMRQQGRHHFWGDYDSSWESTDCILTKVRLELDLLLSNNRRQLYNALLH